jgi:hypothetical protein
VRRETRIVSSRSILFVPLAGDFFHADEAAPKGYRKRLGGRNPRVVTSERGR